MATENSQIPDLATLIALFYEESATLGAFHDATSAVPESYRQLLDHNHHMTVSVEEFHATQVDVVVLQVNHQTDRDYCREILLVDHQAPDHVIQYGIVRLNLDVLQRNVRDEIVSQRRPLGRVLIENRVLRQVKLNQLYQVTCGPKLSELFKIPEGSITFGRTAMIYCDGEPAVELLEIVSPVGPTSNSPASEIS